MNYTDKNGQLVNEQLLHIDAVGRWEILLLNWYKRQLSLISTPTIILLHIQKWNKEYYLYTQMPSQNHGLPWGRTAQSLHYKMP